MVGKFSAEKVMLSIKQMIKDENISIRNQFLASGYYERRMETYRKQEKIVIFGSGNYGRDLYKMLKLEEIHCVKCFCDNSTARQGKKLEDMDIVSPQEAFRRFPDAMYIITPKGYENEISRQLAGMGVNIQKISVYITELTDLMDKV